VKRSKSKTELVQNAEEKLSQDGIPFPSGIKYVLNLTSNAGFEPTLMFFRLNELLDYMYRRFLVQGTLQPQNSILISPREYGGVIVYHLIMLFDLPFNSSGQLGVCIQ
jgi:cytochrome oxidase assembly protein ShyY1